ncbi:unnamed protein product [Urochloa humidicola]
MPPPRPPSLPAELRALDATFAGVRLVDTMVGICAINQAGLGGTDTVTLEQPRDDVERRYNASVDAK